MIALKRYIKNKVFDKDITIVERNNFIILDKYDGEDLVLQLHTKSVAFDLVNKKIEGDFPTLVYESKKTEKKLKKAGLNISEKHLHDNWTHFHFSLSLTKNNIDFIIEYLSIIK